jgi:serine/threonine-protein kinase
VSAPTLAPVQPGEVLRGKYVVERLLGQGGMAFVIAARHLHLDQTVAIKLLRPDTIEQPEVVQRFLREARAASRIESPHITRVLDVDTLDGGAPFIVMEYLEGADLARVLQERGPIPAHEVAAWVRDACLGVAEAHAQGIVHRDLKPGNIFLAKKRGESVIKVLDFGISKLREDARITQTAVGMGSAAYMSPEQMRDAASVDARSDVWSLGVTLYELCTGQGPFFADSVAVVCAAVLSSNPAPPRTIRPDVPPGLEAIIMRCLAKDPAQRYATVTDLANALAPFAVTPISAGFVAPTYARPSAPSLPSPFVAGPPPPASTAQPSAPAQRSSPPWAAIASGVVATLIVLIVAFSFGRGRGGAADKPAEEPPKPATSRYKLAGDTLVDTEAKLTWQRTPAPGAMDWTAAKAWCSKQGGGYRLPEIEELAGLVAVAAAEPPIDAANFGTTPIDVFWSVTPAGPSAAMVVYFSGGRRGTSTISSRNRVRCVK